MAMRKYFVHIYIVFALCLVGIVVGSFFDFQISDSLYQIGGRADKFGLTISVLGAIPGFVVVSFIGGGFLAFGLKRDFADIKNKKTNLFLRILMFVLAAASYGLSVYFTGREFFGLNGFQYPDMKLHYGYFIAAPIDLLAFFVGYVVNKKTTNKKLWVYYLLFIVVLAIALLGFISLIKIIDYRPRFRSLGTVEGLNYHNWWSPFKNHKTYLALGVPKEEFKSFPSGHAAYCVIPMMFAFFLPLINKNYKKYVLPLFYAGLIWLLLVAFSRIYVGAHFLSDVSMGALLVAVSFFILNIVIDNNKYLSLEELDTVAD